MERLGFRYYDDAGTWRSPVDGTLLQKDAVFIRNDVVYSRTKQLIPHFYMFSARDLVSVYLNYYKHGGVRYSLQNDVVILRAIESILQKQLETPEFCSVRLSESRESRLKQKIESDEQDAQKNRERKSDTRGTSKIEAGAMNTG